MITSPVQGPGPSSKNWTSHCLAQLKMKSPAKKQMHSSKQASNTSQKDPTWAAPRKPSTPLKNPACPPHPPPKVFLNSHPFAFFISLFFVSCISFHRYSFQY